MKYLLLFLLFFSHKAYSQIFPENGYVALTNNYNAFIDSSDISWAAAIYQNYSFLNCKVDTFRSIHDFIIDAKDNGEIKSYTYNSDYEEVDKNYSAPDHWHDLDTFLCKEHLLYDSLNRMYFDQTIYLQSHKLRSYVIAAAPAYDCHECCYSVDGIIVKSYCSLNKKRNGLPNKKDKIIHLKTTYLEIGLMDWLEETTIKKTYGMNVASALWYDASKGYNETIDIKYDKKIPAENILSYDSISIPQFDTSGTLINHKMIPGDQFPYFTKIGLYQDWYYDITEDIFFCNIPQVDLFASLSRKEDDHAEKKFKIIFK